MELMSEALVLFDVKATKKEDVISCAVAGAVAGALGAWCNAAWGGLVVLPVASAGTYLIALAVGIACHIGLVMMLKKDYVEPEGEEELSLDDIEIEF